MKNDDILFLQASNQPKLLHHLAVGRTGSAYCDGTDASKYNYELLTKVG